MVDEYYYDINIIFRQGFLVDIYYFRAIAVISTQNFNVIFIIFYTSVRVPETSSIFDWLLIQYEPQPDITHLMHALNIL